MKHTKPASTVHKGALIQSLQRGFGILEMVGAEDAGTSLAEICRKSGLHRSTAHHLLRTLVVLGYLVQDTNSKSYRLGPRVFQLASSTWSEGQMAEIALPLLDELVRKTQETANLAVRKGEFRSEERRVGKECRSR